MKETNYGFTMPNRQACAEELMQSVRKMKATQNQLTSMDIVELLYPTYPPTKKRFPLTRCLLVSVIESVTLLRPKNEHNFRTVIDILSDLLEDINDSTNTRSKKLRVLTTLFVANPNPNEDYSTYLDWTQDLNINLPAYVYRAMELFYHYGKIESQQYTVAGLIYDLMPLMDVTFDEIRNAMKNRQTIKEIVAFQEKNAMYKDDRATMLIHKVRKISETLFASSEPTKSSIFQAAIFAVIDSRSQLDLDFSIELVKDRLMLAFRDCQDLRTSKAIYKSNIGHVMNWYCQIAESSNVSDMIVFVMERILMLQGNVSDLILPQRSIGYQDAPKKKTAKTINDDDDNFLF